MAKILLAYAYTTSADEDGHALTRPDAFKLDQNTPILLDHPDITNLARANKGVILSSSYDKVGCKVEILVFDDALASSCNGLSITAPLKAWLGNKIGMTPIELSLCKDLEPRNSDCRILASRDATTAEIALARMGDHVRKISELAAIGEQINELFARWPTASTHM